VNEINKVSDMRRRLRRCKTLAATFWQQRNRREQLMLTAAAGVVLCALIYLVLIEPAMTGRQRLQSSLPSLRQQTIELQQLLRQAQALPTTAQRPAVAFSQSDIEQALARNNLSSKRIALSGDSAKLELAASSFSGLLNFLQEVQKTAGWQVSEASFNATAQPGLVDTTITLRQKRSQ